MARPELTLFPLTRVHGPQQGPAGPVHLSRKWSGGTGEPSGRESVRGLQRILRGTWKAGGAEKGGRTLGSSVLRPLVLGP